MADPALAEDVNGVIIRSHVAAFYSFGGYPIIPVPLTLKKGTPNLKMPLHSFHLVEKYGAKSSLFPCHMRN